MLKYIIPTFIIYNIIYTLYYKKDKKRIKWAKPIKKEYIINYNNSVSKMFEK